MSAGAHGRFVEEGEKAIKDKSFPPGILSNGEDSLSFQKPTRLAVVVPITLGLIFLLLYSVLVRCKGLVDYSNIPLAFGELVGLFITGENLSVPPLLALLPFWDRC